LYDYFYFFMSTNTENQTARPPVVAIMGHIDHGKSTILSCIRNSAKELREAGGITQHISAYEVESAGDDGRVKKITFLDTPGHEAFCGERARGAGVADVAVLVVSAEDGVKPQTLEALRSIESSQTPFIVAINKIDKDGANIDRTKQSLAENNVFVEGYGGTIPVVPVSGKTGDGITELLDMILLVADMADLKGDPTQNGSGIVIESNLDPKKGLSATCIIKNGTVKKGQYIVAGEGLAPVRIMENYLGKQVDHATFSSPIKIIGWNSLPETGAEFFTFDNRDEAFAIVEKTKTTKKTVSREQTKIAENSEIICPIIVKADTSGSLEAVIFEIKKLNTAQIGISVVSCGIGAISENDIRLAQGSRKVTIVGFNVKVESLAKSFAERAGIEIKTFDIIYKMTEWLKEFLLSQTPKVSEIVLTGSAKILKVFSKTKDKQIIGASVQSGNITVGSTISIKRRDSEIGQGKIRGLEQQKKKTDSVATGTEFGAMVEAKIEIAPGDILESFITVEK
jgi:translation initiation factor IF-2